MLARYAYRFCKVQQKTTVTRSQLFDNIIKIIRPFDVRINFEEMLETVKIIAKYVLSIITIESTQLLQVPICQM